jgi:hypothetical protein
MVSAPVAAKGRNPLPYYLQKASTGSIPRQGGSMSMFSRHNPTTPRTAISEIDRRAIGLAGRLLISGIWIERQVANAPKLLTILVGRPDWP